MAGININQNLFNYGELDETLYGATDSELYNHGLACCKNVIVSTKGGLYSREGSTLVHYYTKRTQDGYVGRYKRNLHTYNLSVYEDEDAGGKIQESGVLTIFPHGMELFNKYELLAEKLNIDWLTSDVINNGYTIAQRDDALYLFCKAGIFEIMYHRDEAIDDNKLTIERVEFDICPTQLVNNSNSTIRVTTTGGDGGLECTLELENGDNDNNRFVASDKGQHLTIGWSAVRQHETNTVTSYYYAWFRITNVVNNSKCFATLLIDKSNIANADDIEASFATMEGGGTRDYMLPAFGANRGGYPTKACFFKSRVWMVDDKTNVVYASCPAYETMFNFMLELTTDAETNMRGISYKYSIDTTTSDITWIHPLSDKIVIGTLDGLFISDGAGLTKRGELMSFSSMSFVKFSSVRSGYTKPITINASMFFTGFDGKSLYEVSIDSYLAEYRAYDLSMSSQHILRPGVAGSISYSTYPYNIITVPLNNGTFAMMTYNRGSEIYGWTRHKLGGDNPCVESVASLTHNGRDYIFMCVSRVINGEITRSIEYIENKAQDVVNNSSQYHYVDTAVKTEFTGIITDIQSAMPAKIEFNAQAHRTISKHKPVVIVEDNSFTTNKYCGIFAPGYWDGGTQRIVFSKDILPDTLSNVPQNVLIFSGQADEKAQFWLGMWELQEDEDADIDVIGYLCLVSDQPYRGSIQIVFTQSLDIVANKLSLVNHNAHIINVMLDTVKQKDGLYYYRLQDHVNYMDGYITVKDDDGFVLPKYSCEIAQRYADGKFTNGNNLSISYQLPRSERKGMYWYSFSKQINYGTTRNMVCNDTNHYTLCTSRTRIIDNEVLPQYIAGAPDNDNALTSVTNFRFFGAITSTSFLGLHRTGKRLVKITYNPLTRSDTTQALPIMFSADAPIQHVYIFAEKIFGVVRQDIRTQKFSISFWFYGDDISDKTQDLQMEDDDRPLDGEHVIIQRMVMVSLKKIFYLERDPKPDAAYKYKIKSFNHPLGIKVRCAVLATKNMIFVGGLDGLLYQYTISTNTLQRVLLNNQANFRSLIYVANKLYGFTDIGDVIVFDLNDVKENTEDTITYARSRVSLKCVDSIIYINSPSNIQVNGLINSNIGHFVMNDGYTNVINRKDKIRVSDVAFMDTLNKKPYLKVALSTFNCTTGAGTIVCERFPGDITLRERYDKGQANNGVIHFAHTIVKGLDRFNGQILRVALDGRDIGEFVVKGDAIRLPDYHYNGPRGYEFFTAFAGYPYEKEIHTLNLSGGSVKGSSVGLIARQYTLALQCHYSRGGEYSADGKVWYPLKYSSISDKTLLDTPYDLYTGMLKLVMPNSTTDVTSRRLFLRHTTAEPFAILSITRDTYVSDN